MQQDRPRLTPKQQKAITALLTERTMDTAAAAAGVNRSTLFRWLQDEAFQEAYQAARTESFGLAIAQLHAAAGEAVEALRRNLTCRKPMVETMAARAILELGLRAKDQEDLERRLEELEGYIEAQKQRHLA